MKIVRIIARLNVGGPARHVVWLTAGLDAPDCQTLLVSGTVPAGEDDMAYFATDNGVAPFFISQMSREISPKDVLTIWKLFRLFLRERPDVVHTHTAKAGTVGRVAGFFYRWLTLSTLWGRPRRCRFVHTYHGHIFHGYYGPTKTRIFLTIERLLARLTTDRIIVISEQQRREIHETYGVGRDEQFAVIPLGLDTNVFSEWSNKGKSFRDEVGVARDDLLVGIVGRLTEIKNHDLFLRAVTLFKQLNDTQRKVKFVIIGDGALRNTLESHSRELGLSDDVIFAGNRKDAENFYPALDVIALTSRNEGTPLTLIEAMSNSRPVIATAVGGVIDLLGDPVQHNSSLPYVVCNRGISVPPNRADAFAAGLHRIVSSATLREELGANGLQYVAQKHSKDRLLTDVRNLYVDLLRDGSVNAVNSKVGSVESRV